MKNVWVIGSIAVLLVGCGQTAEVKTDAKGEPVAAKVEVPPAPEPPKAIEIPAGTRVTVRTNSALSTKTASSGETFTGSLSQPILIDGKIAVPQGAAVEGLVAGSDDGGRV